MKELIGRFPRAVFDLRVIVAFVGVVLSIAMHELFHIITHWGEIRSIGIFPDSHAIVEIVFAPAGDYDLVFEEGVAYMITMIVLILTVRLVCEIHDFKHSKSVSQTILTEDFNDRYQADDELKAMDHLGSLLGIGLIAPQDAGK